MRDYNPNMPLVEHNWDEFVAAHPRGHVLQTHAWGKLKSEFGWWGGALQTGPEHYTDSGALVLFRPLPLRSTLAYVPRGPVVNWDDQALLRRLFQALDDRCRRSRAMCLKLEPDLPDEPRWRDLLRSHGFHPSPHLVQPPRSLVVDLTPDEAAILARMKPKTRYNIGLAGKRGVTARAAGAPEDLEAFNRLMALTGSRDGFGVHAPEYYRRAHELFAPTGRCALILAEWEGQTLAGVMAFTLGKQAWYFYGASSDVERQRMAPYLAQWEAMRWAKGRGALTYDLWGVPDADEATLEAGFEQRRDGLWGVYRFKRGWGGTLTRTVGAWDRVYNWPLYWGYLTMLRWRRPAAYA